LYTEVPRVASLTVSGLQKKWIRWINTLKTRDLNEYNLGGKKGGSLRKEEKWPMQRRKHRCGGARKEKV
jgi:hypothetical protein